jgi:hypothetical protein
MDLQRMAEPGLRTIKHIQAMHGVLAEDRHTFIYRADPCRPGRRRERRGEETALQKRNRE